MPVVLVSHAPFLQEKGQEDRQTEIGNRIRQALHCGLKVLEDAFDKVEVAHTPG